MARAPLRDTSFLGRGWSFLPRFDAHGGAVMVEAEEDILDSLRILFATRPGERVLHPEYGAGLQDFVFESMTPETIAAIRHAISHAVLHFEPRISLESITVEAEDWPGSHLYIQLVYLVRATNNRANVVFPFYLAEGTLLSDAPQAILAPGGR